VMGVGSNSSNNNYLKGDRIDFFTFFHSWLIIF
jgi:hypothetical protein